MVQKVIVGFFSPGFAQTILGKYSFFQKHVFKWYLELTSHSVGAHKLIFFLFCLGGRPCIAPDCQLIKQHLGYQFAAAQIGTNGGYAEISSGGRASDYSVWNGWKNSPGHNDIMLAADGEYPVFGCFNEPSGEFAHCIFFQLDKKLSGGYSYNRDCS